MARVDPNVLLEFADTDRQQEVLSAVIKYGSNTKASEFLKCNRRSVDKLIERLSRRAASQGVAPHRDVNHRTMDGFNTKFVTSRYDGEGNLQGQYVRQEKEKSISLSEVIEAIEGFEWTPAPKIKAEKGHDTELLTLYTLTDFHLGCYAWKAETGNNWDMTIAEHEALSAITRMAEGSPNSEVAILNLQGDFLHWDGLQAVTPISKHILDADGRWGKLIELSLTITMQCVEILLLKHKKVKLLVCEGNHDESGSAWLRKAAKVIYKNNPRLEVDDTEFPYYAHLHGEIMLGFHHGHKKKNAALPTLFSSEPRYRSMWGNAKYCYIHTGHYHHAEQDMSEQGGAIVERHPTIAGSDAYAARGGYISWRAAHAITYHSTAGEHSRKTVVPSLKDE